MTVVTLIVVMIPGSCCIARDGLALPILAIKACMQTAGYLNIVHTYFYATTISILYPDNIQRYIKYMFRNNTHTKGQNKFTTFITCVH